MSVALACSWRSHHQQIVQALDGTDSNVCVVDLACGGMAVAMTTLTNLVSVYCLASKSCLSSLDHHRSRLSTIPRPAGLCSRHLRPHHGAALQRVCHVPGCMLLAGPALHVPTDRD